MTIRFTEGFGIYGTGDITTKLLDKWTSRIGTGAINTGDGRHAGTTDYGIQFATLGDALVSDLVGIAAGAVATIGFAYRWDGAADPSNFVELQTSSGSLIAGFAVNGTGGDVLVQNAAGTYIIVTATGYLVSGTWAYIELVVNTASGGTIALRKNGVQTHSAAHGQGVSTVNKLKLVGRHITAGARFQDIYVLDNAGAAPQNAPLGDVRIETLLPNAVGASSGWAVVHQNRLTANQASLETDTVGWAALANTSIARTTAYASHGSASLSITCTAGNLASAITTEGTGGVPVLASTTYSARFDVKNTVGFNRTVIAEIRWYDSGGAVISTTTGTGVVIPPSGTGLVTVSGASPSNAAFAAVIAKLDPIASGDVLYIDAIQFSQMASIPTFKLPERHNALNDASHDGDASYVSSDTAGQKDTYVHSDLSTVSGTVFGVRPALTFNRQAVGARTVGAVARVGTTDHDSAATVTPDDTIGVYKTKSVDFPTNPGTGAAWTPAEVNAAEFGPKIVT